MDASLAVPTPSTADCDPVCTAHSDATCVHPMAGLCTCPEDCTGATRIQFDGAGAEPLSASFVVVALEVLAHVQASLASARKGGDGSFLAVYIAKTLFPGLACGPRAPSTTNTDADAKSLRSWGQCHSSLLLATMVAVSATTTDPA